MKRTGPCEGTPTKYWFGTRNHSVPIEATSLEKAIRQFRIGTLFPHQYSTKGIREELPGPDGYDQTVYLRSEPGGEIPICIPTAQGHTEICRISPEAGADEEPVDGPLLSTVQGQIGPLADAGSTALAPASTSTGLRTVARRELETRTLALQARMGELQKVRNELSQQVHEMKKELEARMEQLWMIELFLGSKEEVKRLATGSPAPASTPLTVRQRVLCMDEEIAVWDWMHTPDRVGVFDFRDLDAFDTWLTSDSAHLSAIFPHEKGIVGLRVRRRSKFKGQAGSIAEAFARIAEDEADQMTYLLVKNGENLYRLWVDVTLFPRLFAAEADTEITEEMRRWPSSEKEVGERMKTFFAGLLVVQGLIERSDLFHPLPKPKVSVFDPADAACFEMVRDGEERNLLADASNPLSTLTWKAYLDWLRTQISVGMRVQWIGQLSSEYDKLYDRTGIRSVRYPPKRGEIYTIDGHEERGWSGERWSFLYLPGDTVGYSWGADRRRRVRFFCYHDEVFPIDLLSWRILEHLLLDRNSRADYTEFFPILFHWWNQKKREAEREKAFVDLVLVRNGVDLGNESERARCERLIRWWKHKTKEHRDLTVDEAKALRMIEKAFVTRQDEDNDSETQLFSHLSRSST